MPIPDEYGFLNVLRRAYKNARTKGITKGYKK